VVGLGDVSRSPQVDFDQVPDQVAHIPARACRDVRVEPALLCCFCEELRFLSNSRDVLSDLHGVLPIELST
jgi:hypothetical protein